MNKGKLRKRISLLMSLLMVLTSVLSFSTVSFAAEDTSYDTFSITNGYGFAGRAGVRVTKGASAEIDVSIKVKTVTQDDLVDFIRNHEYLFNSQEYSTITEGSSYSKVGAGASLFCGLFGAKYGSGSTSYYKNSNNRTVVAETSQDKELLKELHDLTEQEYMLTGKLRAVGESYVPTEAVAFVEVTRITFQDGTTLKVINTSATVAEPDGTRDGISGDDDNEPLVLIPLD